MDVIAPMRLEDLDTVLDWAAAEGWNPGHDDAEAFLAADPDGFLLKTVDGRPAAAISVVNHSPEFSFLGLYICAPEFRGQGHGWDVWQAGLAHAGRRVVGLDGVPAQQANYARSGFEPAGRTVRYKGRFHAPSGTAPSAPVRAITDRDVPMLIHRDGVTTGVTRPRFIEPWLRGTSRRRSMIIEDAGHCAYATIRDCREGHKIGPFAARTEEEARVLLSSVSLGRPVLIDVPESSLALSAMLTAEGFLPVFETARMYLGAQPDAAPPEYFAVATLELG